MPSNDFFRSLTAAARLSGFARKQAAFLVKPVSLAMLFTAALAGQALTITTTSLPTGTVNVQYGGGAVALAAKGGVPPYVWSLVTGPLPPGLSLSSAGLILGTPSTGGAYPITVSVTDSSNVAVSKQFTVQIAGPGGGSTPSITTTSPLPAANVGQSYSQTLSATGGTPPYTWSGGQGLPAGLTLGSNRSDHGNADNRRQLFLLRSGDGLQRRRQRRRHPGVDSEPVDVANHHPGGSAVQRDRRISL